MDIDNREEYLKLLRKEKREKTEKLKRLINEMKSKKHQRDNPTLEFK